MEELPLSKSTPTTSYIIAQIKLAKISNSVQAELPTHHRPIYGNAIKLEEDITLRLKDLPPFFDQNISVEPHLELPKTVLLWRSFHLRIVLNRPSLFEAM
ncbi:C6 transcription factor [Penicillium chrysogenum]|nr:C6 transcription factor [Penicillium chrysogenum]